MNKGIPRSLMALAFVFLIPAVGFGCSCDIVRLLGRSEKQQIKDERKESTAVFSGEVLEIIETNGPENKPAWFVEVRFRVQGAWKGIDSEVVSVSTAKICCICGYEFTVGQSYLVYASGGSKNLSTSICTRTRPLSSAAEDLKVLGKEIARKKKTL